MEKNNNIVKAINKNVRSSPRKISLVLDYIRGKKVDTVLRYLDFIRKSISKEKKQLPRTLSIGEKVMEHSRFENLNKNIYTYVLNAIYQENKEILLKTDWVVRTSPASFILYPPFIIDAIPDAKDKGTTPNP